jgi:hypothetical protein
MLSDDYDPFFFEERATDTGLFAKYNGAWTYPPAVETLEMGFTLRGQPYLKTMSTGTWAPGFNATYGVVAATGTFGTSLDVGGVGGNIGSFSVMD